MRLFLFFVHYVSGLNIVEVAHDNQSVVKKFITDDLKLINSFDTWHGKCVEPRNNYYYRVGVFSGTKNVAKNMSNWDQKGSRKDLVSRQT